VVAVILGMIVLHERLNWRLVAGSACIILGLALIVWRKQHKTVTIPEAAAGAVSDS
jgi:drug/metabolite transporter (DMT)-like permease